MSAWFVIADSGRWAGDTFVVQIDDAAKVQYAREVLAGGHADAPSLGGVITK